MFVTNLRAIVFFGRMFTSHLEILFWVDEPGISLDADRPDVLEVDGSVCHRLVDCQIHTLEVFARRKDDPADKPGWLNSIKVLNCNSTCIVHLSPLANPSGRCNANILPMPRHLWFQWHLPLIFMISLSSSLCSGLVVTPIVWCLEKFCKLGSGLHNSALF